MRELQGVYHSFGGDDPPTAPGTACHAVLSWATKPTCCLDCWVIVVQSFYDVTALSADCCFKLLSSWCFFLPLKTYFLQLHGFVFVSLLACFRVVWDLQPEVEERESVRALVRKAVEKATKTSTLGSFSAAPLLERLSADGLIKICPGRSRIYQGRDNCSFTGASW